MSDHHARYAQGEVPLPGLPVDGTMEACKVTERHHGWHQDQDHALRLFTDEDPFP
jgi:hypothetical protein